MVSKRIRVGIVFGGRSGEHEVSIASAQSVMAHIDRDKYVVVPIGITKAGQWIAGDDPMEALASGTPAQSSPVTLLADPSRRGLWNIRPSGSAVPSQTDLTVPEKQEQSISAVRLTELDVVFPVLHGTYGEDGTVQGLLELAGVPYVGCGVLASAVAMDKAVAKDVFAAHGLPVLPYLVVKRRAWQQDPERVTAEIEDKLLYPGRFSGQAGRDANAGFPIFVKPANMGSSVGISKVHSYDELPAALDAAALYDRKLIIEKGIEAREIEVSVLGNDEPIASVPGEVVPCREFYDYQAKYIDDDSELLIPAPLDAETTARVREMAILAFKAIDGAGMARADFLLDKGTGEPWINELNTIPGFTQISMYPKLWEATGISYPELIDRLIELSIVRFDDRSQSKTSFSVPERE